MGVCLGPIRDVPSRPRTGSLSTEVDTDVAVSRRRAVVTGRVVQLDGEGKKSMVSAMPIL